MSYQNAKSCKRDILDACFEYRELQPKQYPYRFNNGRIRDLICLDGTIPVPVHYASQFNYMLPVTIFLLDTYPTDAPICYVQPTPGTRE